MRNMALGVAAIGLLALSFSTAVTPARAAGLTEPASAPIVLAQNDSKKSETVTEKVKSEVKAVKKSVKRNWKKLTGYKFAVACPALIPLNHSTCTETGKNKAAAQAKCQSQHPLCSVKPAS